MDLGLSDKVAIVTGSARGLGAATARRLAEEGAKVVITDINADQAQATAAALKADGLVAHCIVGDITRPPMCSVWLMRPSRHSAAYTSWSTTPASRATSIWSR